MKIFIAIILVSFTCKLTFAQEQAPTVDDDKNWVSSIGFNLNGQTVTKSVNYFNSLGKGTQQQQWDPISNNIWISQTEYDSNGRSKMQTFSAPIKGLSRFIYNTSFLTDILLEPISDYTAPLYSELRLSKYYSDSNTDHSFQDITEYPYSSVKYSNLNPGDILEVYGGNKIKNEDETESWLQSYSFTLPVGTAAFLKQKLGNTSLNVGGYTKTVIIDVHGQENVVFKDAEDNLVAAARSGQGTKVSSTFYLVSGMDFIDFHVPQGCSQVSYSSANYALISGTQLIFYNLKTDERAFANSYTNNPGSGGTLTIDPGVYRAYFDNNPVTNTPSITVEENYYDFSVNTYDEASRLVSAKQPLNSLESTYEYNTLGQLQETTSVDEGHTKFKYRLDGQIRFSQNEKQKEEGEFSYTNYDLEFRPVESGVFKETDTYGFDRGTNGIDNLIDLTYPYFIYVDDNDTFKNDDCYEQQFTLYDEVDTDALEEAFGSDSRSENYSKQTFVAGAVSKTFTQNPNTSTTWYSYDILGRVTWIVQKIEGLSGVKTIDYEYDFATGQVAKVYYQKGLAIEQFVHKYIYNIKGQLVTAETSIDDVSFTENAEYKYAETGELVRVELEEDLQGIDYVYNLKGQLKAINHPSLEASKDPGGDTNDVFGMIIDYHKEDYKRSNVNINTSSAGEDQFNGNIKAVRWNNSVIDNNTDTEKTYAYSYNRNNWLTAAKYGQNRGGEADRVDIIIEEDRSNDISASSSITVNPGNTGTIISPNANLFIAGFVEDVNDDYEVSNITYDANGNIQSLKRNKHTEDGNNAMDNMTYHYDSSKPNQLKSVEDVASNTGDTSSDDIKNQDVDNYEYNEIGQLIINNSEKISYTYNAAGLVTSIAPSAFFTTNPQVVRFTYNDRGHRVSKKLYRTSSNVDPYEITYYVRDATGNALAIYTQYLFNGTVMQTTLSEQMVYGVGRLGVYKRASETTAYELKDHLGNVRALIEKADSGGIANKGGADYYPFGMQMPLRNSLSDYRYAYQGQEKDSETGKEAFQLRLWDARIGRWLTTDPYGEFHSPYLGMGNNPISNIDPDGGCVDCDPNAAIGSTAKGSGGYEYTQTETGWQRNDGFVADLGSISASKTNLSSVAIPLALAIETSGAAATGISLSTAGLLTLPLMFTGDTYDPYEERFVKYGAVAGAFPWTQSKSYDIVESIYNRNNSSGYYLHYTTLPSAYSIYTSQVIIANSSNQVYVTNALMAPMEAFSILFQCQETHKERGNAVIIMKLHNYQEAGLKSNGDVFEQTHLGNLKPEKIIYAGPNPF